MRMTVITLIGQIVHTLVPLSPLSIQLGSGVPAARRNSRNGRAEFA